LKIAQVNVPVEGAREAVLVGNAPLRTSGWRHVGFLPVLVGIEDRDRRRALRRVWAEILLIEVAGLVDDEGRRVLLVRTSI
jgi:hypothetical protein